MKAVWKLHKEIVCRPTNPNRLPSTRSVLTPITTIFTGNTAGDHHTSKLEQRLREKEITTEQLNATESEVMDQKLDALCCANRIHVGSSVLEFWESQKFVDNSIYLLSQTVLAVPATQVSVERAFSALSLFLTPLRTRLLAENLENALLVKLNKDLLQIVEYLEEE